MSGPDIFLRDVCEADMDTLYAFSCDQESCEMAAFGARPRARFDERMAEIASDPTSLYRVVVLGDVVVGSVLSWVADGERLLGYWISREHWGRGIASRALGLFLQEFRERPITAIAVEKNVRSQSVLVRNGFVEVGRTEMDDPEFGPLVEVLYRLDETGA